MPSRRQEVYESILAGNSVLQVDVPAWKKHAGTTYFEVVASNRDYRWSVWRRFGDFARLKATLEAITRSIKHPDHDTEMPPFPGKHTKLFTNHNDEGFLERRRVVLENFLQVMITNPLLRFAEPLVNFVIPRADAPGGSEIADSCEDNKKQAAAVDVPISRKARRPVHQYVRSQPLPYTQTAVRRHEVTTSSSNSLAAPLCTSDVTKALLRPITPTETSPVPRMHSSSNTSGSGSGDGIHIATARPVEIVHNDLSKASIPEGEAVGDSATYALPSNSSTTDDASGRTLSQCEDFSANSPHDEHKTSSSSHLTHEVHQNSRSALDTHSNCSSNSSSRIEVSPGPHQRDQQRDHQREPPSTATSHGASRSSGESNASASPNASRSPTPNASDGSQSLSHRRSGNESKSNQSQTNATSDTARSERDQRRASSRIALAKAAEAIYGRERSNTPWDGLSISEAPFIIDLDEETEVFETAAGSSEDDEEEVAHSLPPEGLGSEHEVHTCEQASHRSKRRSSSVYDDLALGETAQSFRPEAGSYMPRGGMGSSPRHPAQTAGRRASAMIFGRRSPGITQKQAASYGSPTCAPTCAHIRSKSVDAAAASGGIGETLFHRLSSAERGKLGQDPDVDQVRGAATSPKMNVGFSQDDAFTSVSISKAMVLGAHVVFDIDVRNDNLDKPYSDWKVLKRFNDFANLDECLRYDAHLDAFSMSMLPALPPKAAKLFVNHRKPTFVEKRRILLENFLKRLISVPELRRNIYVLDFLGVR